MGVILEPFLYIIGLLINIYVNIVIVEVVLHWLLHFGVFDMSNRLVRKTIEVLEALTHPVYQKISRYVPPLAGIDFSPFILLIALLFVGRLVFRLQHLFL